MKRKPFTKVFALMLALFLAVGGTLTVPSSVQAAPKVKKITLNATSRTLYVGKTTTLKVKSVTPKKASKKVTFKSSNKKVATVNSKGVIKAVKPGKATITVTSKSNKKVKATCKITVKQYVKKLTVKNAVNNTVAIKKGKSLTLQVKVEPSNASNKKVTYTTKNKKIATVNSKGKVTAKKAGKTTITIKSKDGKAKKNITVIVPKTAVSKVKLNTSKKTLTEGSSFTLKAMVSPSKATTKIVSWKSSNTKVATVSTKGKVVAKKPGKATITVTTLDGNKKATCKVTVKAKTVEVTKVTVNPTSKQMTVGETATITAAVVPANATNKTITWSTNNNAVATVANGKVTAKAAGTAVITAKSNNGKSASCTVTVVPATVEVTSVSLDKATAVLYANDTLTLKATVAPANATNKTITWSSSNKNIADVKGGEVTPVSEGTAVITAKSNNGKSASCTVTVVTRENALETTEHEYIYTLNKGAENYLATYNNGTTYAVTTEDVAKDVVTFKNKLTNSNYTNATLADSFNHVGVDDVENLFITAEKLFLDKHVEVISETEGHKTLKVTKGNTSYNVDVTLVSGNALQITDESNNVVNIENIDLSSSTDTQYRITATVSKVDGITAEMVLYIAKDGTSIAVKKAVAGAENLVASYEETADAYVVTVDKTYYSELLNEFNGTKYVEDYVNTTVIENDYEVVK